MVDAAVVQRKLRKLSEYLQELEEVKPPSFDAYVRSRLVRRSVERLLQLLVEVASDINTHIIVGLGHPPPDDYFQGFIRMGELGVLAPELAARLAPAAGARNILVHEYEAIDDRIVYASIPRALEDFRAYGRQVLDFLHRTSPGAQVTPTP